jgi:hypothetical protein
MKRCPFCAEAIQDAAILCRFCNHRLDDRAQHEVVNARATDGSSKVRGKRLWLARVAGVLSLLVGLLALTVAVVGVVAAGKREMSSAKINHLYQAISLGALFLAYALPLAMAPSRLAVRASASC